MDEAIIQLQTTAAHQAEEISSLSKELYAQQKELEKLKQIVANLKEEIRTLSQGEADGVAIDEPPPPHY
jgi:uncharacterized coiled-coil protein SlyX